MDSQQRLLEFLELAKSGEMPFHQAILLGLELARARGFEEGAKSGFAKGVLFGYELAMEQTKPALSDGLRHGSPECGRAMRARRKDA